MNIWAYQKRLKEIAKRAIEEDMSVGEIDLYLKELSKIEKALAGEVIIEATNDSVRISASSYNKNKFKNLGR